MDSVRHFLAVLELVRAAAGSLFLAGHSSAHTLVENGRSSSNLYDSGAYLDCSECVALPDPGFRPNRSKQWDRFSSLRSPVLFAISREFLQSVISTASPRRALNRTDIALAHSSIAQLIPRRARSLVRRIDRWTSPA
jgi:hypothetical protein